jgi:hypothetical protein
VLWVNFAWVLDVGGGHEADLGAEASLAEDPMQLMLAQLGGQGRHG